MDISDTIPKSWRIILRGDIADAPLRSVAIQRADGIVIYPPAGSVFRALELTPPEKVRAVILGQDPYHEPDQATGLAFAVTPQCAKLPPSLKNILKELESDMGIPYPTGYPDLSKWAKSGVLLLNTCLTVKKGVAFSHANLGWERVTDAIISAISINCSPSVFILWGGAAQAKRSLIDESRHGVLASAHPSPLSAFRGFFGSKPFSSANNWLKNHQRSEISWQLS